MTIHTLGSENTVLSKFIAEIRDRRIHTDSMRFRRNLERIGEVTAYEISKTLDYEQRIVETPLGEASVAMISDRVVLATILRAGLPFHQGFLNYFDDAQNAFVSAYRKSTKDGKFKVKVEYISCGDLEGKVLLRSIRCLRRDRRSCWPTTPCANAADSPSTPMWLRSSPASRASTTCGRTCLRRLRPCGRRPWTRS